MGDAITCMYDIIGDIEGQDGIAYVIPRLDNGTVEDVQVDWQKEKAELRVNGQVCLPRCTKQDTYLVQSSTR